MTDGERVYAYFGNVGLFCYDMNGKELWTKKWGVFPMALGWGTAASPILYGDLVILNCGPGERTFLLAGDRES